MASHRSAVKAHRQSEQHRIRNRQYRTRLRTSLKSVREIIAGGDMGDARSALRATLALVDRMASKGIIHANTAARYKSRLVKGFTAKAATASS